MPMSSPANIQGRSTIDRAVPATDAGRPGLPRVPWVRRLYASVLTTPIATNGNSVRKRNITRSDNTPHKSHGGDFTLESLIQYSEDAIITKDLRGNVRSWNPAAQRTFGFRA